MGLRTCGLVLLGFMVVYVFLLSVFWPEQEINLRRIEQRARAHKKGAAGDCDPTRICPGGVHRDRTFATDDIVPPQSCGDTADFCAVHDCLGWFFGDDCDVMHARFSAYGCCDENSPRG